MKKCLSCDEPLSKDENWDGYCESCYFFNRAIEKDD